MRLQQKESGKQPELSGSYKEYWAKMSAESMAYRNEVSACLATWSFAICLLILITFVNVWLK